MQDFPGNSKQYTQEMMMYHGNGSSACHETLRKFHQPAGILAVHHGNFGVEVRLDFNILSCKPTQEV